VVPSIDSSAEMENITAAERDQPRCGECNQSTHPD
jgi:hypothetical protein